MNREQDLDRNEQATPYKLQEARKQGQTARSADFTSLCVLAVAVLALYAYAPQALQAMARLLADGIGTAPAAVADGGAAAHLLGSGLLRAAQVLAPLLLGVVVIVVVGTLLQSGPTFSTRPLKPDPQHLNPLQGLKRLFSWRLLYEAFKSSLKLLALIGVAALALQALAEVAVALSGSSVWRLHRELLRAAGGLAAKLCAVVLLFALVDLSFVRWEFARKLRMSRREIEDEHKHREGDPKVKSRQREVRAQFLQRSRSVRDVPGSSVVLTNPTHVAVALKYEHGVSVAPQVVAKGRGVLALRIRRAAQASGVPIVHSPRLARALFKEVEQGGYVPQQWYPPVARILVWLQAVQAWRGSVA